jgi:hypothetical protein
MTKTNELPDQKGLDAPFVSTRFTFEIMMWRKQFPDEEYDADNFYDWAAENSNTAFRLALEVARDLGF